MFWCRRTGLTVHNNVAQFLQFLLISLTLIKTLSGEETACAVTDLVSCGKNEMCVQQNHNLDIGLCKCLPGFDRGSDKNTGCVSAPTPQTPISPNIAPTAQPHTDHSSKNAVVAGVLVPLVLLAAVVAGVIYMGRRYNWLHRLRQLRPIQRTNDVLIGRPDDDDDPIA